MKKYQIEVSVKVKEQGKDSWNCNYDVQFAVTENVPPGTDPVAYLRQRLSEEVKRHSATAKLEWQDEANPNEEI